jgi:KTSC domain
MAIERQPIRRGGIRSAGYDRAARTLEIEFDNGSVVQHTGVGDEIARRFLTSSAPASLYRDAIQEEFTLRRVK